ncbi:hypothetical protein ACHWQZ_G008184 [Mnemiopsis leidyi]
MSKVTKTSQVQDENVPDSEQQVPKCPTFRVMLVKRKDENVPDSDQQGRKRPTFRSARYENGPDSNWQVILQYAIECFPAKLYRLSIGASTISSAIEYKQCSGLVNIIRTLNSKIISRESSDDAAIWICLSTSDDR